MALTELPHHAGRWRTVAAASIGNGFEWGDLSSTATFAMMIARVFFPTGSETTALARRAGQSGGKTPLASRARISR
jgi:MFS transporter, MHS family, proline/betaine transporter